MAEQAAKHYETADLIGRKRTKRYKALLHEQSWRNFIREVADDKYRVTADPPNYSLIETDFPFAIIKEKPVYGARVVFPALKIGEFIYKQPEFIIASEMKEEMVLGRALIEDMAHWRKLKELAQRKKTPLKVRPAP